MNIDMAKIAKIVQKYAALDPLDAYYRSYQISSQLLNPFPCSAEATIAGVMTANARVLDIGCGDGHTLIQNTYRFQEGIGIDESAYIIAKANYSAIEASTNNVRFLKAKVMELPFDDGSFDFVFSERGPLGHDDATLAAAIRVLKPGGRIFIETMGSFFMRENDSPDKSHGQETLLTTLDTERDRFQRSHIEPMLLMSHVSILHFGSLYDWFEYHCAIERYMENPLPSTSEDNLVKNIVQNAADETGALNLTQHHIWMGGVLKR